MPEPRPGAIPLLVGCRCIALVFLPPALEPETVVYQPTTARLDPRCSSGSYRCHSSTEIKDDGFPWPLSAPIEQKRRRERERGGECNSYRCPSLQILRLPHPKPDLPHGYPFAKAMHLEIH